MKRLLTIDDDSHFFGLIISAIATPISFSCQHARTFASFKEMLTEDVSVIMVDLMMPGMDGIEVLRFLSEQQCRAGILLFSGADRKTLLVAEEMARELRLRVLGRLSKPLVRGDLEAFLRQADDVLPVQRSVAASAAGPVVTADALRRAITQRELVVHYQPQITMATGEPSGVEALVRWQHPEHGLIYPDSFIPLAESMGVIEDLTWRVVEQVFEDEQLFAGRGWAPQLSINISAYSLCDLKLPDRLFASAQAARISPDRLIVEITESGTIQKVAQALDILARLRLRGIHLSIDDFGTGFSMMHQLKRIPASEIKIDRGFVAAMETDHSAEVIVRKTTEIGHELRMKVVAEGVETQMQYQLLKKLNCDIAQGYLFARPMSLNALLAWRECSLVKTA
jgi:EAL domain-containing protein (putative c-di-GMP-specific phosphodiesterase class I)/ActR/RegA family two-component response regulator